MGTHHRIHTSLDRRHKGRQLDLIQSWAIVGNHRQRQMGIDRRVAMAGKMLGRRQNRELVGPGDEGRGQLPDQLRIVPKRSHINHRISGVVIHIHHRPQQPIQPDRLGFRCRHGSQVVGQGQRLG